MLVEDQSATLAFLTDPATYGAQAAPITTIETHISVVVLVGQRAYKLKRAVRLPYVDFSTVSRRLLACQKELTLNRRTAPSLYVAVRHINRGADGRLTFDGPGPLVDAVVEMARFDEDTLFDRLAAGGRLTTALLTNAAKTIARFHDLAAVDHSRPGARHMSDVLEINEHALAGTRLFALGATSSLNRAFRRSLEHNAALLDAREKAGKIRHCHGDLHLRNICLVDGVPTLFDCIEFDENLATIDVFYDLAFLIMDLWHRGLRSGANVVLNRYLDERRDLDGLAIVPFFMAVRSVIRAHVLATQRDVATSDRSEDLAREAKSYFDLSAELLQPRSEHLIAIGGLSGSGKSTVSAALAEFIGPPPGARVLSSDRVRKRLHGVTAETRLPPEAYMPEVSQRVYALLFDEARETLERGHAVIADAVFDRATDRDMIEECAKTLGVPFSGFWLEAPSEMLLERVETRQGDPSDATADVLRAQIARQSDGINWRKVPSRGPVPEIAARIVRSLGDGH